MEVEGYHQRGSMYSVQLACETWDDVLRVDELFGVG